MSQSPTAAEIVPFQDMRKGRIYRCIVRYRHGPKLYLMEWRGVFTGVGEYHTADFKFPGTPVRLAIPRPMFIDIEEQRNKPTYLPRHFK